MSALKEEVSKKTTKELQREDPDFLPSVYGLKKSRLAKLKKEYDVASMPESLIKDDANYDIIHKKAMAIVKVRTFIEKKKKELTDDARKWTNLVNSEAKKFTEIVAAIEKPWKDRKAELDNAAEIKAENERLAELKRTEEIESRVNLIVKSTENLLDADSSVIEERLNYILAVVVDESFEESEDIAIKHKNSAVASLKSALQTRLQFETQQEQMEKDKLLIEGWKAELANAKKEIEDLQKANLVSSPETSNQTTVSDHADIIVNDVHRHGSAHTFNHEDVGSDAEHPSAAGQSGIQTETKMVQDYMQELRDVDVPDVGSDAMVNLVNQMTSNLEKLQNFVLINTQE